MKKTAWFLFAFLCLGFGLYPLLYFILDEKFGLLNTKPLELLSDLVWRTAFYIHIILGGLALLVGWPQFNKKWRIKRLDIHRLLGKIYVTSVFASSLAGIFIGFQATGGLISKAGFISLGIIWFFSTLQAFLWIKKKDIIRHEKFMIFSYAACFAAVTLRLWLPLLIIYFEGEFIPAYRIVSWLCWVPNLIVAWVLVKRMPSSGY